MTKESAHDIMLNEKNRSGSCQISIRLTPLSQNILLCICFFETEYRYILYIKYKCKYIYIYLNIIMGT